LQKLVKQRKDSLAIAIESFLPKQLSDDELRKIIMEIVTQTGATSVKDMGKVMGAATKQLAGKADNKKVSEIVKSLLQV
jgi:uncharacterized protein YqeY